MFRIEWKCEKQHVLILVITLSCLCRPKSRNGFGIHQFIVSLSRLLFRSHTWTEAAHCTAVKLCYVALRLSGTVCIWSALVNEEALTLMEHVSRPAGLKVWLQLMKFKLKHLSWQMSLHLPIISKIYRQATIWPRLFILPRSVFMAHRFMLHQRN